MVAVDSKSIPEKQSISLNLSKETEDNLNTELFSEIFSSESINNDSIPENKGVTDNDKIDLEDAKYKSENTATPYASNQKCSRVTNAARVLYAGRGRRSRPSYHINVT